MTGEPLDALALRRAFAAFPSGVTALAAFVDDGPVGMAASSFTSVSLDPALVSVCVAATSETWPALRGAARIGVSVLAEHHAQACRRLAGAASDRFTGLRWFRNGADAVLLADATALFECSIHDVVTAGDHYIAVLRVHAHGAGSGAEPLVFHESGFRRLAPAS